MSNKADSSKNIEKTSNAPILTLKKSQILLYKLLDEYIQYFIPLLVPLFFGGGRSNFDFLFTWEVTGTVQNMMQNWQKVILLSLEIL